MAWVMSILSICHIYRTITDYGGYTLDFSGPMMILAQKLSLVAFAIHDGQSEIERERGGSVCVCVSAGMGGNPRQLNKDQEQHKLQ